MYKDFFKKKKKDFKKDITMKRDNKTIIVRRK